MEKIICHSSLSKKFSTIIRPLNETSLVQKKIIIDDTVKFKRSLNKAKHGIIGEKDREIIFYVTQNDEDLKVHLSYILLAEIRNSELYKKGNDIGLDAGNTFLVIKKSTIERL